MGKIITKVTTVMVTIILLSGCVVDQQQKFGANSNREEGYSGFGTDRVRSMEGPLSDMMVPDAAPKGRVDLAKPIAEQNDYVKEERLLDFEGQGTNRNGNRVLVNRPGTLRGKYLMSDKPHLTKKYNVNIENLSDEDKVRQTLFSYEEVEDVHIVTSDGMILVGVESPEQNRRKLRRDLKQIVKEETDVDNVIIALERPMVSRIQALEHGISTGEPFEEFGAGLAEIIETFENAVK
ncbi:YhcN/YlaJ family sporulation lipoprotein [Bacillus alkalicellulosilyticus]|uniref:YhcN/YlaJ family sporulation lipoprotein n=1 Tax=Alkalihalobacterium alkalicellulosilyticum TaxID=1912214 RepID=UPI00148389E1|nr:YhcN/YlaJ family sporulation lipoprotein [Bacillus alkalicellulosilyticus]